MDVHLHLVVPGVILLAALGVASVVIPGCDSKPIDVGMPELHELPRWEYRILVWSEWEHQVHLEEAAANAIGSEGWELTTSWFEPEVPAPSIDMRPMRAVLLFRRSKR
jgi:hypothetical protein